MSSNRNLGKVLSQLEMDGEGLFIGFFEERKKNRMLPCAGRCSQSLSPGGWPGGWESRWRVVKLPTKRLISPIFEGQKNNATGNLSLM
jgi:hypothetical protein